MRLPAYGAFRHTAVDVLSCVQFGGGANVAWPAGLFGAPSEGWAWAGWFWPFQITSAREIFYSATADTPRVGYGATGLLSFARSGQALITAGTPIPAAKRWIHGAVSVTPLTGNVGYDWAIYQFGELVASGREVTGAFVAHTSAPAGILGSGTRIGRQTIWRRGITQAEVRAHFYDDKAAGAAADWPLDEGEGSSGANAVAGGSPLVLTSCTYVTDTYKWAPQIVQPFGSVLLPGAEGSHLATVSNAALPQLAGATGITLVGWHRPRFASGATLGSVIAARSGTEPGAQHLLLGGFNSSQSGLARIAFNDTSRSSGTQAYTAEPFHGRGRWRMSAVSFDSQADLIRNYSNGLLYARTAGDFNGNPFSVESFSSLHLGEDAGGAPGARTSYNGWLGPQRVYDRVLTNAQVRDVYRKGSTSVQPAFEWLLNEGVGATAASTGKFAAPATLVGTAAWSLEQPF